MSYERPYGGRRRRRDDYDQDRRRDLQESPEQRLQATIIRLGDVDVEQEIPQLATDPRFHDAANVPVISEGLRLGITEQPYKIPHYAALLRVLSVPHPEPSPPEGESAQGSSSSPSVGRQILDDFWRGFQAYLDQLAWRQARLCIHFFAHLTEAGVVTPQSMLGLLQSFTAVLDEFGVSTGRGKRAARCAAEGLMRAGRSLKDYSPASVIELISTLQAYNETIAGAKWLVQPITKLYNQDASPVNAAEILDCAVTALKLLEASDFSDTATIYPQPYADLPSLSEAPFDLPSVLVPPEVIELDGLSTDSGEDALVKKEEWPEHLLRLFDNDVTPDPATPAGYAVRADLLDIIDIFEVNRKECARILAEYPRWTVPGTFKPKPGTPADVPDRELVPGRDWQLESSIIETILGAQFILPESPEKPIYYITLITELCKLSPQTVGPAVGKSIRKLYSYLADGLDVEVGRRFAEWFAVHMSNFGFQWVWKEWVPDLSLPVLHPKRVFMHRALEIEIRLSYLDRILKTLPEAFHDPAQGALPEQAPGPEYDYDDPSAPHHDSAQSVLNQLRGRAKPEDVMSLLESLKITLVETADGDINVDSVIRSIAVQSLLHIGSRSFSHFLNAIERYLLVLRNLASGGADAKADLLSVVSTFWRRNRQMISIVFDKLMQYQIVDPTDVVGWVFTHMTEGLDWDVLKGAVDKANGRVVIARKRVAALRKEQDDTRARAKASGGADDGAMEVDGEIKQEDTPADSPALVNALNAFTSLTREQKSTLARVLEGFVHAVHSTSTDSSLIPDQTSLRVISPSAWEDRGSWGNEEWKAWQTWVWYKHFCRTYSPYLRSYATTLSIVSFAAVDGADNAAAVLMKKIWALAIGQD
ncbi:cap binding protein 80-PB [Auriscalpium vulgare]|uniref:Cap binding protein 80-PB n=1 Tax=Auriscalpium vulgare TaxID=40419 RepID=A0ACB8S922_9AGAM|nr:cap binding protein 80-PB [Auriscalpium vulgare]